MRIIAKRTLREFWGSNPNYLESKMNIKPLKTEQDYDDALERINQLMDSELGSPEGDELDVLSVLVEKYEDLNYPVEAPNPIEAIRFKMEQFGLKDKDLVEYIGQSGRVSEVMSYKRKLTLTMIRNLEKGLNISAKSLIEDYEFKKIGAQGRPNPRLWLWLPASPYRLHPCSRL